jgi:hypothetical protein
MLRVPTVFGADAATKWFERWGPIHDDSQLSILLPDHVHISPAGMVLLAAGIANRRKRNLETMIESQRYEDAIVWQFFARLDAARAAGVRPASEVALNDEGVLRALSALVDLRWVRQLADWAAESLESQVPSISPSIVRMARFVFEEMGANVVQHSGNAETGFGVVQANSNRRRLELAFADCGMGFRASLQRNPELAGRLDDDAQALQLALSPRITGSTAPRTNMGIGLKLLTDFSDLLGGDLWIASGSAMLQRRTTAGQRTNVVRSIPEWRGAWICLDAPL